jgi:HK97 family phage portal protein
VSYRREASPSWLVKTVTTIANWLVVGGDPKIRDPQNSSVRMGSSAGVSVNDRAAMGVSAFFACVRLIASTIASLPFPVLKPGPDGALLTARDEPLHKVLNDSPNADQTPVDYMEFAVISMLMRGDHFARKLKIDGRLVGLEPVRPDIVTVRRAENGERRYRWAWDGESFDLGEEDVFHVPGFGGGPLRGLSILAYARDSLGVAIAADQAAASMFANGARPTGALSFKEWLQPDQRDASREVIEQTYAGAMNAGRPMILEGGSTWTQISMNADDAQLLESRAWSVEEICRWFGVPPILIGHNEKTTSWGTGIEQLLLGFQKFTLNPYLRRIEQAVRKQLLTPAQRAAGLTAKFNLEGLLRADSKARADFYGGMTRIGAMTINEVREKEDLPRVEGGDVPRLQMQNVPISEADAGLGGEPKPAN